MDWTRQRELHEWLSAVLVASVFVAPEAPGLSEDELLELARRRGFGKGEVRDALRAHDPERVTNDGRLLPSVMDTASHLLDFNDSYQRDPRSYDAVTYIRDAFEKLRRDEGAHACVIARAVLVERGVRDGQERLPLESAITSYVLGRQLLETPSGLRANIGWYHPPRAERRPVSEDHPAFDVLADVRDICGRRSDGRPSSTDVFKAFSEKMPALGYSDQRIWWEHTANELSILDPLRAPQAFLVTAAALAEGALTFVVRHAQKRTGGKAFSVRPFTDPPQHWKFEALIRAARHETAGIIDGRLADACTALNEHRQRIHPARFIERPVTPTHVDVRPHHAEEALATTRKLVGAVLEWLARADTTPSAS